MTNGGGEGGSGKRNLFRGNDFAYALARMAVAQICESAEINTYQESHTSEGVRFSSFQQSALETLTDVVIQYIQSIGKTAQFYANVAGRVEGNALDIVQALEDLGSGLGFSGAPDVEHCLADSGVVKDIIRYTGEAEEVPFVYSLPRFPFNKGKRPAPSFSVIGAEPPDEHIPVWLPAFPETKMSNGTVENNIEGDAQIKENGLPFSSMQQAINVDRLKVQKSMDQKDVQKSMDLKDVQKTMDQKDVQKTMDQKDVQKPTEESEVNPFLAAPIWVGEKNVPPMFFPTQLTNEEVDINHVPEKHMSNSNRVPALEAYTASDKINDKNSLAEKENGEEKDGARTQRALLRFKIGNRKASASRTIQQSLEEKGWFEEDRETLEKKVERVEERESIDTDVK